jgi:hypothetical protein
MSCVFFNAEQESRPMEQLPRALQYGLISQYLDRDMEQIVSRR